MKLGILGTGMIVKDVLTMYHELGVEKTYLFSTKKSKSQALELIEKYHLDKVYTDYDEYDAKFAWDDNVYTDRLPYVDRSIDNTFPDK